MGNQFACVCTKGNSYPIMESPYVKVERKYAIRFWAEPFILVQSGAQLQDSKWQMLVQKLVPVNVVKISREGDLPCVSHVTAFNTKFEKIIDVIVEHPGVDLYRPSNCFVYWKDSQKDVSFGLNFLNPYEAADFVDELCGRPRKQKAHRRANSTMHYPQKKGVENPTLRSLPGTPDMQKRLQKYCQPCETQPLLHHYKLTETPSNPGSYPYIRLPTQSASVQTSAEFEAESQVKIEQNNNAEMVELNPQQKMNFEKSNLVKPQEISSDLETRSAPCEPESSSISSYGSVKAMRHALSSLSAETGLTVMEIERKISSSSSSDEKKNVAKTKPHSDRKIVSRKKKVRKSGNTQTFVKNREPKNDKNGKECVSRDNSLDFVWNKVETEMEQSKVHPKKATLRIVATEDGNFHAVNKISQNNDEQVFLAKTTSVISGKIRKAGYLSVLELLSIADTNAGRKSVWTIYWACLRGRNLVLTPVQTKRTKKSYEPGDVMIHLKTAESRKSNDCLCDNCIVQIGCHTGKDFLIQTSNPAECENWLKAFQTVLNDGQNKDPNIPNGETVISYLKRICGSLDLDVRNHCVVIQSRHNDEIYYVPEDEFIISNEIYTNYLVLVKKKCIYNVSWLKQCENPNEHFGLTIKALKQPSGALEVVVSSVEKGSCAQKAGIQSGDEILNINQSSVLKSTATVVQQILKTSPRLFLTLRTKRPNLNRTKLSVSESENEYSRINRSLLTQHSYSPAVSTVSDSRIIRHSTVPVPQSKKRVSVATLKENTVAENSGMTHDSDVNNEATLVSQIDSVKLQKIVYELLTTEKCYTNDLQKLRESFLFPLKYSGLICDWEMEKLMKANQLLISFHQSLLGSLNEWSAPSQPSSDDKNFANLEKVLKTFAFVFNKCSTGFRIYSTYCAAHFAFKKTLQKENCEALQLLLETLNDSQQQASALDSFLIKPIQRVLRYPLFLRQILNELKENPQLRQSFSEALEKLERVAECINEAQRVYEEFGTSFRFLELQRKGYELDLSDLLMYGELDWLNYSDELSDSFKLKNLIPIACQCFVFRTAVVVIGQRYRARSTRKKDLTLSNRISFLLPISEVQITGQIEDPYGGFMWSLLHKTSTQSKLFHFSARTSEICHHFVKTIRSAILSYHRKSVGIRVEPADLVSPTSDMDIHSLNVSLIKSLRADQRKSRTRSVIYEKQNGPNYMRAKRQSYQSSQSDCGYASNN